MDTVFLLFGIDVDQRRPGVDGSSGHRLEHGCAAADIDELDLAHIDALLAQQGDGELIEKRARRAGADRLALEILDVLDLGLRRIDRILEQQTGPGENLHLAALLDCRENLAKAGQHADIAAAAEQRAHELRAVGDVQGRRRDTRIHRNSPAASATPRTPSCLFDAVLTMPTGSGGVAARAARLKLVRPVDAATPASPAMPPKRRTSRRRNRFLFVIPASQLSLPTPRRHRL
jgi:hypothetical protein